MKNGLEPVKWRPRELTEGESITGSIARLPSPGKYLGNALLLTVDGEGVALPATPKKGHTVLRRELQRLEAKKGDRISIRFHGMRRTQDGERSYRQYEVRRV